MEGLLLSAKVNLYNDYVPYHAANNARPSCWFGRAFRHISNPSVIPFNLAVSFRT